VALITVENYFGLRLINF